MQMDSCLPGIITSYDSTKCSATIRPLITIRAVDGSYINFPEIQDVPVITPATAYSGIKLPVKVGDKVMIHVADRDIQTLLFRTATSGLTDPGSANPATSRRFNLTDAVAYTGLQSLDDMIPSDDDVWIFNNFGQSGYSYARFKSDGAIDLVTENASITISQDGTVAVNASAAVDITAPITTINGDLQINGNTATTGTIDADLTITSTIDCVSGVISGKGHKHIGNLGAPTSVPTP
jgi:hypothetical protein